MNPPESVISGDVPPTVAVLENNSEDSTIQPETHTFVPFIPTILPESSPAVSDDTQLVASAVEEVSSDAAAGEAQPEVEDIPPLEVSSGSEAEPGELDTEG